MSDTIAARLGRLLVHVPDLTLEELDELAGLSRGHSSQIARGAKANPWPETVERIGSVIGARASFLTYGDGTEPCARTVRGAVKRARGGANHGAEATRTAK